MNLPKIFITQTETVAGIFAQYGDAPSCLEIYKIKQRSEAKPLAIYTNDVFKYATSFDILEKFITFFKGEAITIVAPAIAGVADYCVKDGMVGIRMLQANHAFTNFVTQNNLTLVGTSANISNDVTPAGLADVKIKNIPILNLNCKGSGQETTVVKITQQNLTIIREGFNMKKITNFAKHNNVYLTK